ncbi:TOMM precursor leader peptide-binding protein [Streptacidiphilus sp. 4-A2]|nr:TOMM precursor leader peptide-binding protein [Streptacidiphilus sp. 4-A2]
MTETLAAADALLRHDGGQLGQALAGLLAAAPHPLPTIRVLAADTPGAGSALAGTQRATPGESWLPVVGELDRVVIGPLVRPGQPGCDRCLDARRAGARADAAEDAALHAAHGARLDGSPSPLLTPLAAALAARLALREAAPVAAGDRSAAPEVVLLRLRDLRISRHRLLPDPHCPHCGTLPEDSPAAAVIPRVTRPKPDPGVLRVRDLRAEEAELDARYVDDETGVIKGLQPRGLHALPFVESKVGPRESVDGGYGRAFDFRSARVTAIAEALERLGGGRPGGRRTTVEGCYRELADRYPGGVLDPAGVGGHEPHRYQEPGFPLRAYQPERVMPWVWGYSLTANSRSWCPRASPTTGSAGTGRRTIPSSRRSPTAALSAAAWRRPHCTGCWNSPNATPSC